MTSFFQSLIDQSKSKPYSVERHGSGWAIYAGRDLCHHGANLGHLTETTDEIAARIETALNLLADQQNSSWKFKRYEISDVVDAVAPDGRVFSVSPSELSREAAELFNAMVDALISRKR